MNKPKDVVGGFDATDCSSAYCISKYRFCRRKARQAYTQTERKMWIAYGNAMRLLWLAKKILEKQ
jgi:hypothetical protein